MKQLRIVQVVATMLLFAMLNTPALAETRKAALDGFHEVPAISTTGHGEFRAQISSDETQIEIQLSYTDLEGSENLRAHIHLGQPDVAAGIVIHLCGTRGKPPCPLPPALLTLTVTGADVVGLPAQGIAAGELDEVIAAMRARKTYVNVHNDTFPSGEIRGDIR